MEFGGKNMLLKMSTTKTATTVSASSAVTMTSHGGAVGDLVKFATVGANTTLVAGTLYFIKTVTDANTVVLSATPGGAAIVADDAETGMSAELFSSIGGLKSKSISFSSEGIDVTNHDSDEFKKLLDSAGIRSLSASASGVANNGTVYMAMKSAAMSNTMKNLAFVNISSGEITSGLFKITSVEESADFDSSGEYSISAESSGEISHIAGS